MLEIHDVLTLTLIESPQDNLFVRNFLSVPRLHEHSTHSNSISNVVVISLNQKNIAVLIVAEVFEWLQMFPLRPPKGKLVTSSKGVMPSDIMMCSY